MRDIQIVYALPEHKEFIVLANKVINDVNDTNKTNYLEENIDKDLFGEEPKFRCLIALCDNIPVGMILYSFMYWANDGEVLWISQMYIEEEYRREGVFFKIMKEIRKENPNVHILSCATGNENTRMNRILKGYGAKEIDLRFYYKKI